jgi:hypothetical protein
LFFFNQLKRALGIHGEIDRRLVHVDDNTPVVILTKDFYAHEQHEVKGLALNFGLHALQHVRAHLIGEQMGSHEAFYGAAVCCEALRAELGREKLRPQHDDKLVDGDPLLTQIKDIA